MSVGLAHISYLHWNRQLCEIEDVGKRSQNLEKPQNLKDRLSTQENYSKLHIEGLIRKW